jgi:hypothetical protein
MYAIPPPKAAQPVIAAEDDFVIQPAEAYQIARKVEDLCVDARTITKRPREIDIAITHLETAAMWLNKAHYAAKKEK